MENVTNHGQTMAVLKEIVHTLCGYLHQVMADVPYCRWLDYTECGRFLVFPHGLDLPQHGNMTLGTAQGNDDGSDRVPPCPWQRKFSAWPQREFLQSDMRDFTIGKGSMQSRYSIASTTFGAVRRQKTFACVAQCLGWAVSFSSMLIPGRRHHPQRDSHHGRVRFYLV